MTVSLDNPTLLLEEPEQVASEAQDQILVLWGMVLAGTLAYRDFIGLAAEVVTQANLASWQLADITTIAAVLAGTEFEATAIGYDAPAWLSDPNRVERQMAKMLNTAVSAEVLQLREQDRVDEAMAAQDDLRARKLVRLVDNETAAAYSYSEGVAILTLGKNQLVHGWIRRLGVPKAYPSRSMSWGKANGRSRGGAAASPCNWCVKLNGGNAVRPWYYEMGKHDADRCRKDPVTVPLSQIGDYWLPSFVRSRRGFFDAQRFVADGEFGVRWDQPDTAA